MSPANTAPEVEAAVRAALGRALDTGAAVLAASGTAVDAVEAAVRLLEDAPEFNAGRGAVLGYDGTPALDAAIMDGRDRRAGAVAGVTRTKNPVSLARAVVEASPHVMIAGVGADAFSLERGLDQVDPAYFTTDERRGQLAELLASGGNAYDVDMKYGTVGAVALDSDGHVAAATSTGGVTGKRWGRIGDSPLIGAGTYADDRGCAVSATGSGETFIRVGVAHEIAARVRLRGEAVDDAADKALAEVVALGGSGGVIFVSADGHTGWRFTTPGMFRGRVSSTSAAEIALYGD